jgi:cytochrome c oxidase subunit II
VVTANELHLPVGASVRLDLESADVMHSFWLAQFGWMRVAVPGKTNQTPAFVKQPVLAFSVTTGAVGGGQ